MSLQPKPLRTVALGATTVLFAAGCGSAAPASPPTSAAAGPHTVVVAQAFQSLLYLPLYVGMDKGFFAKEGLKVVKVTSNSGSNAVAAVIAGTAQFSLQDPMTATLADLKGAQVKPIAAVVSGVPVWLVGRAPSGTPLSRLLNGQTVATAIPPSTSTYLLERLLSEHHLTAKLDEVQLGTEAAPVLAGKAALAAVYEPTLEQALSQGLHVEYSFAHQYQGDYAFSSIDATQSYLQAHPKTVQKFVDGLELSLAYIAAHPQGAIAVAKKEFPNLPSAVVAAGVRRMIRDRVYAPSVQITPSAFQNALALQEFLGNIHPGSATYHTIVDATFANTAVHQSGP